MCACIRNVNPMQREFGDRKISQRTKGMVFRQYIDFKLLKCCQPKRQVTIDFSIAFCTLPFTVSILSKTQCSRSIFNSGFSFLAPFCSRSFLKVAQILAQLANVMAQNSSTSVQSLRRDHLVSFQRSGTLPHKSMPERTRSSCPWFGYLRKFQAST